MDKALMSQIAIFESQSRLPIFSILANGHQTYFTRQSVVDILTEQWKPGINGWKDGWESYDLETKYKELTVSAFLMLLVKKRIAMIGRVRDVSIKGHTVLISDNDLKTLEQLESAGASEKNSINYVRASLTSNELVHLAGTEFGKKHLSSPEAIKRTQMKYGEENIQDKTSFLDRIFGTKKSLSIKAELMIIDPTISLESQLAVFTHNPEHDVFGRHEDPQEIKSPNNLVPKVA